LPHRSPSRGKKKQEEKTPKRNFVFEGNKKK